MSLNFPSRRLVSQDDAAIIEDAQVPRSRFVGSWSRKTTFDAGFLVPFLVDEVLPGDHLSYEVTAYVRMSTPLFPLFDNQRIDTHFFFVPCRLVWTNWAKFMGEQATPGSSIDYTVPQLEYETDTIEPCDLGDYMGLPTDVDGELSVNSLPFRAYHLIWDQWFRDQNLQSSYGAPTGDGPDTLAQVGFLQRRAKSHDYFTSALPWPQKFTAPTVPIGGMAPVLGLGFVTNESQTGPLNNVRESDQTTSTYAYYKEQWQSGSALGQTYMQVQDIGGVKYPAVFADLSSATGVAINTFRQAFLVQSLLERDARGGTRYVELIRSHFRVTNPDFRLQRPEYIGGGQTPLQLTPIAQTAPTAGAPVGALGAAGTAAGQHRASYAATEHGYIIGLISVKSELSYQQGLHKMYSRLTRYDFYWPSLAGLGEQAILRKEIFARGTSVNDNAVFGYQERWHEYRTRYSEVTGKFRSGYAGTLDAWHLAQYFADSGGTPTAPMLGVTFIEERPPMGRVLAAAELAEGQQYLGDILINRTAVRPIPTFGTPVTLGRF